MKKQQYLSIISCCIALVAFGQQRQPDYDSYIKQYKSVAVEQEKKYHIPASITLAQGLLESGAGKSSLAVKANNHFGIKCSDWTGDKYYQDDDQPNECFRQYNSPKESYEDHSLFLTKRTRYAALFSLKQTDYKGWANGLQGAGYATDKSYAGNLIRIIETYELDKLDTKSESGGGFFASIFGHRKKEMIEEKTIDEALADTTSVLNSNFGVIDTPFKHKVYKNNGVKYVISAPGDTYHSIAKEFNLIENILRYKNEVNNDYVLNAGEVVYLGGKKSHAAATVPDTHTVSGGESMFTISQYYGVKVKKLYSMNDIPYGTPAQTGQVLRIK
jgi:LysM repeat protein